MNIASKSQAENGNDNETLMTPLRVKQSIKANAITPGSALDYSVLENKPKINNVELNGNKSSNELGINENVQADWNTIDSADGSFIKNKPTIPTKTSDLNNDSGFVKNTDYAQPSTGGVVLADNTYGFRQTSGKPFADIKSYANYEDASSNIFIAKGTLENVITGKGLIDNTVNNLTNYTKTSDLATVATSGNYNDLTNKPTIPTVNNATLTIQKNGTSVGTFTANASSNVTANITVPTKTSDLTNDSNFATESYVDDLIEPLDERVNGEATEELTGASSYTVDNTLDMPFKDITQLLGNTTQASTPSPSSPVEVQTITGRQEIITCGKNLFNKDTTNFNKGNYLDQNCNITSGSNWGIYYIPVISNTAYTISGCTANTGVYFWWLDSNKNSISLIGSKKNYTNITSPNNAKYIGLSIVWNTTSSAYDGTTFMLEQNSSATTYEPYQEQVNEINLGKNLLTTNYFRDVASLTINDTTTNDFTYYGCWGTDLINNSNLLKILKPNTTYTISFKFKVIERPSSFGQYNTPSICTLYGGSTTISFQDERKNTAPLDTWVSTSATFTMPSSLSGYRFLLYNFKDTNNNTTGKIQISEMQIEENNVATDFAPYFTPIELCKIGTYEDKIFKTTGKNLFDKDDNTMILNSVYVNTSTGKIQSASNSTCVYIECKSNTTYTISKTAGTRFVVGSTNETPTLNLILNKYTSNANASSITFKTGANDTYLVAWVWSGGTDTTITSSQMLDSIMIEKSSTATEYEPYGSGEWYVKKSIAKRVLNGTENWTYAGTSTSGTYRLKNNDISALVKKPSANNIKIPMYSNYYVSKTADDTYLTTVGVSIATNGGIYIYDSNYTTSNVSLYKTWLSTHNTIVYYALGTPTYTKLNDTLQEQLNTLQNTYLFKGQTNIIVDGNLPAIIDFIVYKDNVEGKYESLKSMFQKIINMIESG